MSGTLRHPGGPNHDLRVYIRETEFEPLANLDDFHLNCQSQREGEGNYHRIAKGEVFLRSGTENYCLNCAFRHGIIALERPTLEHATVPERDRYDGPELMSDYRIET